MSTTTTTTTNEPSIKALGRHYWQKVKGNSGQPANPGKNRKLMMVAKTLMFLALMGLTFYVLLWGLFSLGWAIVGFIVGVAILIAIVAAKKLKRNPSDPSSHRWKFLRGVIVGVIGTLLVVYFGGIVTGLVMTSFSQFTIYNVLWGALVAIVGLWFVYDTRTKVVTAPAPDSATAPAPGAPPVSAAPATTGAPASPTTPTRP